MMQRKRKTISSIVMMIITLSTLSVISQIRSPISVDAQESLDNKVHSGVSFIGYYTACKDVNDDIDPLYFEKSFPIIAQAGFDHIRYMIWWECYGQNPEMFLKELETVAKTADKYGLKVVYAHHNYRTSSYLEPNGAKGFPPSLFESNPAYLPNSTGKFNRAAAEGISDTSTKLFWTNWWNRDVTDSNGNEGWTLLSDFLKQIVNVVDKYNSTLGYEMLDEHQIYNKEDWEKIGQFYTFVSGELRTMTDKTLIYGRQAFYHINGPTEATAANMAKMAPANTTNVVFKTTIYGLPLENSGTEERFNLYNEAAIIAGVPLYVGEFGLGIRTNSEVPEINQDMMTFFIQKFEGDPNVWGWTYWRWGIEDQSNPTFILFKYEDGTIVPTKYFDYLNNAIAAIKLNPAPIDEQEFSVGIDSAFRQ